MPVSAETLKRLMDAGVTGDVLVSVVEAIDADMERIAVNKPRSANAERQARFRARRNAESVTNNVISNALPSNVTCAPLFSERENKKNALAREIPRDWKPEPEDRHYATNSGLSVAEVDASAEAFRDHHLAEGTTSADFGALFRGWVRNRPVRTGRPPRASKPDPPPRAGPIVNTPGAGARSAAFLTSEAKAGRWSKLYGPPPGQPGCLIKDFADTG